MALTKLTSNVQSPPDHLREAGRELWTSTLKEWSLVESELRTLCTACECADRLSDIRTTLDDGLILIDPSGRQRAHPLLAAEAQCHGVLLRAWGMLDLTDKELPKVGRPSTRG